MKISTDKLRNALLAGTALIMVSAFGSIASASADTYACTGVDIYLALRNARAYDGSNEIGKIYEGETVEVLSYDSGDYWYVYCPKLDKYGYVNHKYLTYRGEMIGSVYTVEVESGYLGLRNEMAFDGSNEIGRLYTDDKVYLQDASDPYYWYVYSPDYDKFGYVNRDFLVGEEGGYRTDMARRVRVESGYLALRTAMEYDFNNEIGELYTGEILYVQDKTRDDYWYVYSPSLKKFGFVNRDYLVKPKQ